MGKGDITMKHSPPTTSGSVLFYKDGKADRYVSERGAILWYKDSVRVGPYYVIDETGRHAIWNEVTKEWDRVVV